MRGKNIYKHQKEIETHCLIFLKFREILASWIKPCFSLYSYNITEVKSTT